MADPELSVVIPAYNEAAVICQTVQEVAAYLTALPMTHEIIVADDGSTDGTGPRVQELAASLPGVRVVSGPHRGKGAAVRRGILDARGGYVLFMDADHSTRISEWAKCVPWLGDGYDVVIGSRKMAGATVLVRQPPLREAMGQAFTRLSNVLLPMRVTDVTCGFKCFQAPAARRIFHLQRMEGWGFDAEILFIARRLGLRIREVPVVWVNDAGTKVRLLTDAARSLTELLTIRIGSWRGWYAAQGVEEEAVEAVRGRVG
jgi:glycosyltransferase involved in cell wall biosynthesis